MEKIEINNYFNDIKEKNQKREINTMAIFGIDNYNNINNNIEEKNKDNEGNIIFEEEPNNKDNKETQMIIEEEDNINNNIIMDEKKNKNNKKNIINKDKDKDTNNKEKKEKEKIKNNINNNNEKLNEENESKKEQKGKKRVRGPNKCYRIIDEFFRDKKRTKQLIDINNELKMDFSNLLNDEQMNNNEEEKKNDENKNRRTKKRIKITEMSEKFDEFLNFVDEKVNKDYYNLFIYPVINSYKEFYIEKEKEFKENKNLKQNLYDEKSCNNINISMDENLAKRKKSYGLENFLEIPEIVNDFVKYIYNKNIFVTDESKIEMIEIIFIFCTWLKQYHYSSYSIEYLIKND